MSRPTSKATFKEHCLRRLGKPVIEINVDEDQLKSAIFSKSSLPFKSVWKDKKSIIVSGDKSRSFLNKTNYKVFNLFFYY